ncbi:hypothetical protein JCM21900_001521 [Sporobolomyces salmonicolor]
MRRSQLNSAHVVFSPPPRPSPALFPTARSPTQRTHPAQFLERLAALFESRKDKGSIFITQKRFTYDSPSTSTSAAAAPTTADAAGDDDVAMTDSATPASASSPSPSASPSLSSVHRPSAPQEYPLLVRATDGRSKKDLKVKLSTIVHPASYASFTDQYTALLRRELSSGLRPKRKRAAGSKLKKLRSRGAAKSTAGEDDAAGTGETPRGGAGAGAGFVVRLPKVVGPRRGNGVKKRRKAEKRREQAVLKLRKAQEEHTRRGPA